MRAISRFTAAIGLAVAVALVTASPATAGVAQPTEVSTDPAGFTPDVNDGAVQKVLQVGAIMYAGGYFTSVTKGATFARQNLFSFNATTGAVQAFTAKTNGPVWALASDGRSLYVGGDFTTVNGVSRRGLAKLNLTTGALDPKFDAHLSARVRDAHFVGGRLIIGGAFRKALQAVDPVTGADTGYINLGVSGSAADPPEPTKVQKFAVNPAGTRLVAVGNFTTVSGQPRGRAFMVDLGATSTTLDAWHYPPLAQQCLTRRTDYMRDVDFSPDGKYFVMVTTGSFTPASQIGVMVCDAAARFETAIPNPTRPTWINYTGGDTLHSVVVTGAAVYVQGHPRWLNNPYGLETPGPGAVERKGIAAINPTTGLASSWNPGKTRGVGGMDLYATPQGLWVPSDTEQIAGEIHKRIAFFPL
jgi:Domain of unknown function (DUF5122) beta-propeller